MDSTPNALYFGTGPNLRQAGHAISTCYLQTIIQMSETEVETVSLERLGVKSGGFDHDHLVIRWVHEGDERQVYIKDPVVIDALKTTPRPGISAPCPSVDAACEARATGPVDLGLDLRRVDYCGAGWPVVRFRRTGADCGQSNSRSSGSTSWETRPATKY